MISSCAIRYLQLYRLRWKKSYKKTIQTIARRSPRFKSWIRTRRISIGSLYHDCFLHSWTQQDYYELRWRLRDVCVFEVQRRQRGLVRLVSMNIGSRKISFRLLKCLFSRCVTYAPSHTALTIGVPTSKHPMNFTITFRCYHCKIFWKPSHQLHLPQL